ncbi:homeobox protein araucan-like isoform X1 [Dreissena polymorpha]|uniref:Homeobox domain-containing protein n=1 Tax=Dreissena polymorpha TaxID=45954 RepID=A0A9D4EUE2_DREPO|nr:homeobox protein araucan-like isoform X1 [Dreissena polymorpha]KAH3784631.1 hypothetical protein DPMN_162592 [Dreissena polymorpha]
MSYGSATSLGRPVTAHTSTSTSIRTSASKMIFTPSRIMTSSSRCCETGRPVLIDPVTGQTICSCQLKTGVPAYLARVPSLPETMYGSGMASQFSPNLLTSTDASSAFYQMRLKTERGADGPKMATSGTHAPFYLEQLMAAHPYNSLYAGFDLNSARRKNATRETTSALKAWLYEHRKNPYPTKGEKIMLAIITRMTLTQVSTWFANARRRLKKESKMGDKDINFDDIDVDDDKYDKSKTTSQSESDPCDSPINATDLSDISDAEDVSPSFRPSRTCAHRIFSPEQRSDYATEERHLPAEQTHPTFEPNREENSSEDSSAVQSSSCKSDTSSDCQIKDTKRQSATMNENAPIVKPKIWSISEIISPKIIS